MLRAIDEGAIFNTAAALEKLPTSTTFKKIRIELSNFHLCVKRNSVLYNTPILFIVGGKYNSSIIHN